ncbi:hypothetical protein [Kitasatospora viridis]|uniref:Uncharacterized protein n=1 Tax=Kitasatospora viridis TaxID=281105 RepID=A0A561ULA5_9ACTN|nr:hypothetical protein [Kitasatospora viridis]TWG00140.1 hypothetical protein FHX73_114009 [Kitasatospora viridis]
MSSGRVAALTTAALLVGLVLSVCLLWTVHVLVPGYLECYPHPEPGDTDPNIDLATPLFKGLCYLTVYTSTFLLGFWSPHLLHRKRLWIRILTGCLLAPLALAAVSGADLLFNVAPAHGLTVDLRQAQPCVPIVDP